MTLDAVPPKWQPRQSLTDFLAAGPAPLLVGLGSTVVTADLARQLSDVIASALQRAGVRGIVQAGPVGDQPFWARRLDSLGTAVAPLRQRRLTPAHLADTIRAALESELDGRSRCRFR